MDKIKKILYELHLYPNKMEAIIKIISWWLSWVFGICAFKILNMQNTVGCTYFVFAISMLMEFAPKINEMNENFSRFIHTCFCAAILVMFVMSSFLIIDPANVKCNAYIFGVSVGIVSYITINFVIVWMSKNDAGSDNQNQTQAEDQPSALYKQNVFEDRLLLGNLGNIEKGENNDG